jgi:hypothetical protein
VATQKGLPTYAKILAVVASLLVFVGLYHLFTRPAHVDRELTADERARPAIVDEDGRRWLVFPALHARLSHPGAAFADDLAASALLGGDARSQTFVLSDPETRAVFIVWVARRGTERSRFEAFFAELKDVARSVGGGSPLTPERDDLRWDAREAWFDAANAAGQEVKIGLWGGLGAHGTVNLAAIAMAPREHPLEPPTLQRR